MESETTSTPETSATSSAVSDTSLPQVTETETSVSTETTLPETEETTLPQTTETSLPETTESKAGIEIPESYYQDLNFAFNCSYIVIPAEYNEGIAYDIHPYVYRGTVYFLLPSTCDLSQVVYHQYDSSGNLLRGRVADFTAQNLLGKMVSIFYEQYTVEAYRSDSPTLYLEIDETYGTFDAMQSDTTKQTKAYGTLHLECREDIAQKYGWDTSYTSREKDADSPCTMYVKGRGNWTWLSADKQGYSIKLEASDDLLGMSTSKKWALIGNQPDNSMLRNPLAYYLGEAAGFDYTPSGEYVDLFVNGEYYGAFLLSEKVNIEDDRLDIADLEEAIEDLNPAEDYGRQMQKRDRKLGITLKYWSNVPNPEDITGGYIIEMEMEDRYRKEPSGFTTKHGYCYVIKSPEYASYEQVLYIATLFQEMEDALYAKDGINPQTGKAFSDYVDLDSFVKKYWIDEIATNKDGAKTSHYLYKPADNQSEKIFAGPVWDYDIAFSYDPEEWYSRTERPFYQACLKLSVFRERANELFFEIFRPAVIKFVQSDADLMVEKMKAAMDMNYIVWKQLDKEYLAYVEDLKTYLIKRINWIREQIDLEKG